MKNVTILSHSQVIFFVWKNSPNQISAAFFPMSCKRQVNKKCTLKRIDFLHRGLQMPTVYLYIIWRLRLWFSWLHQSRDGLRVSESANSTDFLRYSNSVSRTFWLDVFYQGSNQQVTLCTRLFMTEVNHFSACARHQKGRTFLKLQEFVDFPRCPNQSFCKKHELDFFHSQFTTFHMFQFTCLNSQLFTCRRLLFLAV